MVMLAQKADNGGGGSWWFPPTRTTPTSRDHTRAGYAAFYAAVEASIPFFETAEGADALSAHQVGEVHLFGAHKPDTWVNVTAFVEKRRRAIRCHESRITREGVAEEPLL